MDQPITLHPARAPAREPIADPIAGHRVELQLLTTLTCNLKCSYCSLGVGDVLGSQTEVRYGIDELARFAETHLAGKERSTSPSTAASRRSTARCCSR